MFDIAWSEMLLIAVIAIIVVGPKDLPKLMAGIGRMMGKLRRMAREFQGGMAQLVRESEIDEINQVHDLTNSTNTGNMIKKALDPDGIMDETVFPDPIFDGSKPEKDKGEVSDKLSKAKISKKIKPDNQSKPAPKTKKVKKVKTSKAKLKPEEKRDG